MIRYNLWNECHIHTSWTEKRGEAYPLPGTAFAFVTCTSNVETDRYNLSTPKDSPNELSKPAASLPSFSATTVCISYFPFKNLQDPKNLGISSILQANVPCYPTWEIGSKAMLTVMGIDSLGKTIYESSMAQSWDTCRIQLLYEIQILSFLPSEGIWERYCSSFSDTTVMHPLCSHIKKHRTILCKSGEGKLDF